MKIWIDLANTPHVVFFSPIIKRLEAQGHTVVVSLRDFAQTLAVAKRFGIKGPVIGGHGGGTKVGKAFNLLQRTTQLMTFARGQGIDIALSHNSYPQNLAGRLMGCKVVTISDYEGQPANHLAFRLAHQIIVPKHFPQDALEKFGAKPAKTQTFDGYKEQVSLSEFTPDDNFATELADACGLPDSSALADKVVVTVRTPPVLAAYHQFDNDVFPAILAKLNQAKEVLVVALPRTDDQKRQLQSDYPHLTIPNKAVDGRALCAFSDMVISAGGSMNREAALLGTPAYSVFVGAQPSSDKLLLKSGELKQLTTLEQVEALALEKKPSGSGQVENKVLDSIVAAILNA
ncbi:MAG: putative glycosyltransferase [Alteromonadaceae bacterium]|jgi:predicted glycosyltransferase